nr:hypothetical protein HUO10_002948 [Paraburkholderia busanensis]
MILTQIFNDYVRIEANEDIGVATIVLERPERHNPVDVISRFQQKTTTAQRHSARVLT